MHEILSLSASQQARLIREREISPVEVTRAHLERIAQVNPQINAATQVLADRALAEAALADRKIQHARPDTIASDLPFCGVPFSVKDSIEMTGVVCTAGTLGRAHAAPSTEDATLVARLRKSGAIPIAKTNLPDLLFAFESDNLLFGATNNPYDLTRTPGGSSGGEAALIAACGSPMGLGSDCAGSVRLPAAFCGIAAIKPTSGRLPRTGHFPPSGGWIEALWQIGPMARRVEDLCAMMPLLIGPDGRDPSVAGMPFADPATIDLSALRVAFYTDNGIAPADAEVSRVIQAAASALGNEAAAVEEARPACLENSYDLEMKLIGADGGDGLWAYLDQLGSTRVHPLLRGWLDKLEPYRVDLKGFQVYWSELDRYRLEMSAFMSNYDVIVCPAYPRPALPHGASLREENFRGFSHTMAFNLAGYPGAVVRCGESSTGLPISVQIVARPWKEDVALAVASYLEQVFGGWKAPNLTEPSVQASWTAR